LMTYLNDVNDEDGGQTYYPHYDIRVKAEMGKTLIWPAEWTHAHAGEILNNGLKYIVTGWMHFPHDDNSEEEERLIK
jgi:prolyl 4-hydroxylase